MKRLSMGFAALHVFAAFTPALGAEGDYSPFKEASIHTVRFKDDGMGYVRIAVAVTNNSPAPIDTTFECSLFDKNQSPYARTTDTANSIAPGATVAADALIEETMPSSVACRILHVIPVDN